MKAVIQRCFSASVFANGAVSGKIDKGFLILLGITEEDTLEEAKLLATKISKLRIFTDEDDKMNLSLLDVKGEALVVSNFTLCGDSKKGNRPSFSHAKEPGEANELYNEFCKFLNDTGIAVEKGVFGAEMKVSLLADGPVTIILDTDIWRK